MVSFSALGKTLAAATSGVLKNRGVNTLDFTQLNRLPDRIGSDTLGVGPRWMQLIDSRIAEILFEDQRASLGDQETVDLAKLPIPQFDDQPAQRFRVTLHRTQMRHLQPVVTSLRRLQFRRIGGLACSSSSARKRAGQEPDGE